MAKEFLPISTFKERFLLTNCSQLTFLKIYRVTREELAAETVGLEGNSFVAAATLYVRVCPLSECEETAGNSRLPHFVSSQKSWHGEGLSFFPRTTE